MIHLASSAAVEPSLAAGYGTASRRGVLLAVTALVGLGVLVVWALSLVIG
jgi:hypothetical protein